MSQNGNGHTKASLEISGIPLRSECERVKKALEERGPDVFRCKVETTFVETSHPDRRVFVKIDGLHPSLTAWITEALRMSLVSCSYPKFEISAVLLRQ